jgi:bifunctional non-homologous end joining protein LigD
MLATLVDAPFTRQDWVFEEKYDGVRILAYKESGRVTLLSRNSIDRTERYKHIATAIGQLKAETLCLDGEVVVFDQKKTSRFQLLQQGKGLQQYAVFDCLYRDGEDLRKQPLAYRRKCLEGSLPSTPPLLPSARLGTNGIKAFKIASGRGIEGIVAKNLFATYEERRSKEWLKVKVHQEDEFVIGGFTKPTGSREHIGALLLGVFSRGALQYVGKVGSGFDHRTLAFLRRRFQPLIRSRSPFAKPIAMRGATFLSPKLVAQLSFTEWTVDGKLRHPVYLGLRDDKPARDVTRKDG